MSCNEIKAYIIDYIEGNLSNEEEKEILKHMESCDECRVEMIELRNLMGEIECDSKNFEVPKEFISNLRNRTAKDNIPAVKRRRTPLRTMLVAAVLLVITVATVFAAQEPILELINRISPGKRIENIVNNGLGERLNLSAVDKDIRITVTDVAADDIQTLINYKIEDLKTGKEYVVDFKGIELAEKWGAQANYDGIDMWTSKFNFEGQETLTLYPIDTEEKTIHLTFKRLVLNSKDIKESIDGKWNFEITFKKYEGKTYDISKTVRGDGYTIDFNKIKISPTMTVLSYNLRGAKENEKVEGLGDISIIAGGKEYNPYNFGHGDWSAYTSSGSYSNEMTFESMYFDNPKNIEIKLRRVNISVKNRREFAVDLTRTTPQEFEYLGTKLTVDNLKIDDNISFDFKEGLENRQYEVLSTSFMPGEEISAEKHFSSIGNYSEAYYVDNKGNRYEYIEGLSKWPEIREADPVFYVAKTNYKLKPSEKLNLKELKYFKIIIEGYMKTKFVDYVLKVKLK